MECFVKLTGHVVELIGHMIKDSRWPSW